MARLEIIIILKPPRKVAKIDYFPRSFPNFPDKLFGGLCSIVCQNADINFIRQDSSFKGFCDLGFKQGLLVGRAWQRAAHSIILFVQNTHIFFEKFLEFKLINQESAKNVNLP